MNKNKGITLVALIITIIILLILAGITITLTMGDNGILNKAKNAGEEYIKASIKEELELAILDINAELATKNPPEGLTKQAIIDGIQDHIQEKITIDDALTGKYKGYNYWVDDNYVVHIGDKSVFSMVDGVPVPIGFKHVEGTKETGFVIKNNMDKNEFVWIPVEETMTYKYERFDFKKQQGTYSQYSEIISTDEKESIETYKGYYIGRYEAGTDTKRTTPQAELTTLLVQKDKEVYNFVRMEQAEKLAEELYDKTINNVQSKLCSSYAWDTALKFIEVKNTNWGNNSLGGNYTSVLKKTGQTTSVNNIYDMSGNVWEWTTEKSTHSYGPCVTRGGRFNASMSTYPASSRYSNSATTRNNDYVGFRVTIYL